MQRVLTHPLPVLSLYSASNDSPPLRFITIAITYVCVPEALDKRENNHRKIRNRNGLDEEVSEICHMVMHRPLYPRDALSTLNGFALIASLLGLYHTLSIPTGTQFHGVCNSAGIPHESLDASEAQALHHTTPHHSTHWHPKHCTTPQHCTTPSTLPYQVERDLSVNKRRRQSQHRPTRESTARRDKMSKCGAVNAKTRIDSHFCNVWCVHYNPKPRSLYDTSTVSWPMPSPQNVATTDRNHFRPSSLTIVPRTIRGLFPKGLRIKSA